MTDRVLWQTDDELTEQNLTDAVAAANNLDEYVVSGLGFSADFVSDELDIGSGIAVVLDGQQAYPLFPDQRTGLSLTGSATNYVYLSFDPATDDDVYYHIDTDDTPPADPSLKVGEVDTSADTTTATNRGPDGDFDTITLAGRQVDSDEDGVLENADVDALTGFAAGDAFEDYPIHNADIQALQNWSAGDQFTDYPISDSDYRQVTSVDSASTTTLTTSDENEIRVDPSSATVTVTLASADAVDGNTIRIWDAGHASSTNAITVDTEGSETFGDGDSSKTISFDGASLTAQWDSTIGAWLTDRQEQMDSVSVDELDTGRTWQDVTGSRSLDTTYTNNTNSEIIVSVVVDCTADGTTLGLRFPPSSPIADADRVHDTFNSGNQVGIQTKVPPGANYEAQNFSGSAGTSLRSWTEFRP